MTTYSCTHERFAADVRDHVMTVVRANGVDRHLRFNRPGTYCFGFEIITWPGSLCISGDCGTYVFSRMQDMFEFFRSADHRPGYINPGYWSEKVDAQDKTGGITEFCQETFRQVVVEHFRDYWRDSVQFAGRAAAFRDLRENVLDAENEHDAYKALRDWDGHEFGEYYEMRFRKHTGRFIWNCRAIVWAIEQWDAAQATQEKAA